MTQSTNQRIDEILRKLFELYSDLIVCDLLIEAKLWDSSSLRMLQEQTLEECELLHAEYLVARGHSNVDENCTFTFMTKDPNVQPNNEFVDFYEVYRKAWNHVRNSWKSVAS